jgi:transposase-like protein
MAYPEYLRQRAIELRMVNKLSLDEIAERLALSKTTVYYWIKGIPLQRERRATAGQRKGNRSMQKKYKLLRDQAYAQGLAQYDELLKVPTFRDFVVLYVAEGFKRNRNCVSIGNSDPNMVSLAAGWLASLTEKPLIYCIQYHADQNLDTLRAFWGQVLNIDGAVIRFQRKSNSGQLAGRRWRSAHGVLTVVVNDTYLRARLQAWIDRVRDDWRLDSAAESGA